MDLGRIVLKIFHNDKKYLAKSPDLVGTYLESETWHIRHMRTLRWNISQVFWNTPPLLKKRSERRGVIPKNSTGDWARSYMLILCLIRYHVYSLSLCPPLFGRSEIFLTKIDPNYNGKAEKLVYAPPCSVDLPNKGDTLKELPCYNAGCAPANGYARSHIIGSPTPAF